MKIILYYFTVLSTTVFASLIENESGTGGMGSGGGDAVVCYNDLHQITSVELLDLYEQRTTYGLTPIYSGLSIADTYVDYVKRQRPFAYQSDAQILKFFDSVMRNVQFVEDKIDNIPDEGSFEIKNGQCQLQQLAFFNDLNYDIVIYKPLWDLLDPINKVALLMHEYRWRDYKKRKITIESFYIRKHVGFSFMKESQKPYQRSGTSLGICYTNMHVDERADGVYTLDWNKFGGVLEFLKSDKKKIYIRFHHFFDFTVNNEIYMDVPTYFTPQNINQSEKLRQSNVWNQAFIFDSLEPMLYKGRFHKGFDGKLEFSLFGARDELLLKQQITYCKEF